MKYGRHVLYIICIVIIGNGEMSCMQDCIFEAGCPSILTHFKWCDIWLGLWYVCPYGFGSMVKLMHILFTILCTWFVVFKISFFFFPKIPFLIYVLHSFLGFYNNHFWYVITFIKNFISCKVIELHVLWIRFQEPRSYYLVSWVILIGQFFLLF